MNYRRCFYCLVALSLIAGCADPNLSQITTTTPPTPTPTPPIPGFPTPIPTPTPTPTPTVTPTPSPSPTPLPATSIAGQVLNALSGLPISGTVTVALERPQGDFSILLQTVADSLGNFHFDSVPIVVADAAGNGYAIMVTAQDTGGNLFTPALLTSGGGDLGSGDPIVPGTNVGTILLQQSSMGTISGTVSSSGVANTPISVLVHLASPLTVFTGRRFAVPFAVQPSDLITDPANTACSPGSGACSTYSLLLPANPLQVATFNRLGFVFIPSGQPANYQPVFQAVSLPTNQPDCTPSTIQNFSASLLPGQTITLANQQFLACQ
jgi:hypothetical protein